MEGEEEWRERKENRGKGRRKRGEVRKMEGEEGE